MIEFALVLPLLAMLLLGLLSAALLFDADMQLTHAAREGARYGSTLPQAQTFPAGTTWATAVRALVIEREGGHLTTGQVCVALVEGNPGVAVSSNHTTAGGTNRCFDDSAAGDAERRVQVSATRTMTLEAVAFTRQVNLFSRATAGHEVDG